VIKKFTSIGIEKNVWETVIKELKSVNCNKIQFTGGEPLNKRTLLKRIILFSREIGLENLEVYTNLTLSTSSDLEFFVKNNISIATSVYGHNKNIHDKITRINGSFEKTISSIKEVLALGIQCRVAVVGMKYNENYISKTISFLKNIGVSSINFDYVRPAGRGCNLSLLSKKISNQQKIKESSFEKCSLEMFKINKNGHNCFSRYLCITYNGNVIPCIMEREIIYGNVKYISLKEIFTKEKYKYVSNLSKDFIEICSKCEYRYCCFDCRVMARNFSLNKNLLAKPMNCSYNPIMGIWK